MHDLFYNNFENRYTERVHASTQVPVMGVLTGMQNTVYMPERCQPHWCPHGSSDHCQSVEPTRWTQYGSVLCI